MSPEQATALVVAIGGLITAIALLIGQVRALRVQLNGRLTELVAAHGAAMRREGELAARDWISRGSPPPPPPPPSP